MAVGWENPKEANPDDVEAAVRISLLTGLQCKFIIERISIRSRTRVEPEYNDEETGFNFRLESLKSRVDKSNLPWLCLSLFSSSDEKKELYRELLMQEMKSISSTYNVFLSTVQPKCKPDSRRGLLVVWSMLGGGWLVRRNQMPT